ncbi:MAG: hypothetical protein GOMPHAMPRED_005983 [Gomphillus americanus]|uniref:AAA+ ATPase domain-containing protein n=1 Tax=Gomphillus americanus TaxID=1940652 RepID=A0A8H3G1V0_9LECA|nr:MAG: hypothetical protein GOMPHAMPRED_005983 [Gomphillus americanus]
MLFYGPPGTGKTSTILALAKELFGPALFPTRVLELNASDERGISIVREKIKNFARQQLSNTPNDPNYRAQHPCPPFKIIILDEADSMTQDAQSALRRTMETYSRITRFCLVCNYVTRIIDPVASRCSKFRFKSLDQGDAVARISEIAAAEGISLDSGVAERIVEVAEGDLRRAITYLQSGARLVNNTSNTRNDNNNNNNKTNPEEEEEDNAMQIDPTNKITSTTIAEIAGSIPTATIQALITALTPSPKSAPGSNYALIASTIKTMVADGWSAGQTVAQLFARIMFDDLIESRQRNAIAGVFSEVDKRLVDGADEELVLLDLACRISGILWEGRG